MIESRRIRCAAIASLLLLACFAQVASVHAADLSHAQRLEVVEEAQQAYDRGIAVLRSSPAKAKVEFRSAAERFQLVADSGIVNGRLFYNLANAYLQSGDLGRAILNYRRAEQLMPRDARLHSNLAYARSLCRTQIAASGQQELMQAILGWHSQMPLQWRFAAFMAFHIAFWLLLTLQLFRSGGPGRVLAMLAGVAWLVLGASVTLEWAGKGPRPSGVLLHDEVIVRKGNGVGFEPRFEQPVHAGLEFKVTEERGDWLNIQLANGDEGWIEVKDAGLIR